MSDIQEFQNRKGQNIGTFNFDDKTFRKKVRHSKHLFRMRDAWGVDKNVVETLRELGCEQVRIWDEEANRIYSISYSDFYQLPCWTSRATKTISSLWHDSTSKSKTKHE